MEPKFKVEKQTRAVLNGKCYNVVKVWANKGGGVWEELPEDMCIPAEVFKWEWVQWVEERIDLERLDRDPEMIAAKYQKAVDAVAFNLEEIIAFVKTIWAQELETVTPSHVETVEKFAGILRKAIRKIPLFEGMDQMEAALDFSLNYGEKAELVISESAVSDRDYVVEKFTALLKDRQLDSTPKPLVSGTPGFTMIGRKDETVVAVVNVTVGQIAD